jgi:ABC-2 type transport system ATP-binding protein
MRDTPVPTPTGSGFSVSLSDANQAGDVLIALRDHRIDIASAAIDQPSLDDVFMALTGRPSETPVTDTDTDTDTDTEASES